MNKESGKESGFFYWCKSTYIKALAYVRIIIKNPLGFLHWWTFRYTIAARVYMPIKHPNNVYASLLMYHITMPVPYKTPFIIGYTSTPLLYTTMYYADTIAYAKLLPKVYRYIDLVPSKDQGALRHDLVKAFMDYDRELLSE